MRVLVFEGLAGPGRGLVCERLAGPGRGLVCEGLRGPGRGLEAGLRWYTVLPGPGQEDLNEARLWWTKEDPSESVPGQTQLFDVIQSSDSTSSPSA